MSELKTKLPTDTWVVATWDEYIEAIEDPLYEKAKGYYHNERLRIEMSPVGSDHASDHTIIIFAVNLFATLKAIPLNGVIIVPIVNQVFRSASLMFLII
jgi:Uma2 family endonuclease